jgi:hypothetical protein
MSRVAQAVRPIVNSIATQPLVGPLILSMSAPFQKWMDYGAILSKTWTPSAGDMAFREKKITRRALMGASIDFSRHGLSASAAGAIAPLSRAVPW